MTHAAAALPRFLVFGEALTDFVRTSEHGWRSVAGGSCWNVARVAATLGVHTAWAGAVSRDRFGAEITAKSRAAGLDTRFVQEVDAPPLIALVHETNPPDYVFLGSADLAFNEAALPAGWQENCAIAHFGCISLVRQPLGARLVALAERLHAVGVQIAFDPNYRNLMGADYPALFERMAGLAHILKLSEEDIARIYPGRGTEESLAHLRMLCPEALIVYTRGERGMVALAPNERIEQAVISAVGGDSVGSGDGCMGAFVASRLARPEARLAEHLRFTAAAAAVICHHTGAYAPSRAEVDALLADAG